MKQHSLQIMKIEKQTGEFTGLFDFNQISPALNAIDGNIIVEIMQQESTEHTPITISGSNNDVNYMFLAMSLRDVEANRAEAMAGAA